MFRADHATADPTANGTGKPGYTEGNPGTVAATVITASALNSVQEEIARACEQTGLFLAKPVKNQLAQAIEMQRSLDAMCSLSAAPGSFVACNAVAAWSMHSRALPGDLPGGGAPHTSPAWAGVKTNTFVINDNSVGSVTANLTAVAFKPGETRIAVAVGSDGKWARDAEGTLTTGTISGTPDLRRVVYDVVNSLWWAVGPGGIRKSVDGALSWTSVSATQHDWVLPLPSGRVLFYRPGDTHIYSTDDNSTLVQRASVGGFATPVWDASNGQAVAIDGTSIVTTVDGSSVSVSAGDFLGPWTAHVPFVFRGRVYLGLIDTAGGGQFAIGAYLSEKLSSDPADWVRVQVPYSADPVVFAGCGEILVVGYAGSVFLSRQVVDITGNLSYPA